ncbi:pyocin knob domain-containing protein [Dyella silvatica]|uniref:pyocin knob domain-containing protein n=1 Tax=Dyella silvatica TaxID=2992128 RepID=UPI00224F741F|nr:pyocin knob domain-containing protein [Dyella silvatica]
MIDVLTKDSDVTVTDATGKNRAIPSFPKLQKLVTSLTDALTGEVSKAREINSQTVFYSNAAKDSATKAETSATASAKDAVSTASDATKANTAATAASASATSATSSAATSTTSATLAHDSAESAKASMDNAGFSAASAQSSKASATASAALSQQYANAPLNVQVEPGMYSAQHWAEQARLISAGAVIYRGAWDASKGSLPAQYKLGDFYFISKSGTVGTVAYSTGDMVVRSETTWDRIDNQQVVTSVAGKTGAVTLSIADIAGMQQALDGKASSSSPVFATGTVQIGSSEGKFTTMRYDAQLSINGGPYSAIWTSATFNPATKANTDSPVFTGKVFIQNNAVHVAGWGGTPTDGVVIFGGDSWIYKQASAFKFKNEQASFVADLKSGGTIWTSDIFNPNYKLDWRASLGVAATTITDWNNATENGWHMAAGAANAPGGGWFMGYVSQHNNDWIQQELFDFTNGPDVTRYRRHKMSSNWGGWFQIRHSSYRTFVQPNDPGGAAGEGDLWIW